MSAIWGIPGRKLTSTGLDPCYICVPSQVAGKATQTVNPAPINTFYNPSFL